MTIIPKPRHAFIFTEAEYLTLDMKRFQRDLAEIRALPDSEKRKLMGRFIWYPKVLCGTVSYATILADPQMRKFILTATALFPEWLFYLHPKNLFSPVQVFSQLDELLVMEGPAAAASRITAPRAKILTLFLDALVAARETASGCNASGQKFAQQVSDVFGIGGFELATHDDSLVPDLRRPRRKILLAASDLGEPGIEKVRACFAKVDASKSRATFGFELVINEHEELPILYHDSIVRFFHRVYHEIPESFYFLRACEEGLVGVVNCALQLRSLPQKPEDYQWRLSVTPEDVFMLIIQSYPALRSLDRENGFSKADTLDHLGKVFSGFQLKFCPQLQP